MLALYYPDAPGPIVIFYLTFPLSLSSSSTQLEPRCLRLAPDAVQTDMESLPSEGTWCVRLSSSFQSLPSDPLTTRSLEVRRREPCKVVPGNVMLLTRVTIPRKLRPAEDNRNWRCRLLMWHLDPDTKEPISNCIVASLSPGNVKFCFPSH